MLDLINLMEQRFHCRRAFIRELVSYINHPEEAFPATLYIYGHGGTGKTAMSKYIMQLCKQRFSKQLFYTYMNCVECYSTKLLVSSIVEDLEEKGCFGAQEVQAIRYQTMKDLVDILRSLHMVYEPGLAPAIIIALDNAERLRDAHSNVLEILLRLQQLTYLNICVIMISQLPFEKYYPKMALPLVLSLHCAQYTKNEMIEILSCDYPKIQQVLRKHVLQQKSEIGDLAVDERLKILENIEVDFFKNYLNLFLSVFFKVCRELPELKVTARKCFLTYMEPVLDGRVDTQDVTRLWRHIAMPLRLALTQVYLRLDQAEEVETNTPTVAQEMAKALDLPYYGKYLLIAAFLASYNSPKYDKRLFVKHHGKQKKRLQNVKAQAKTIDKMCISLGPKSFSIDRLLAIFYSIIEEKVGLTCNLLSQISTLVHLRLLTFVSSDQNVIDGSAKLQCTVGLEFVQCIGKVVGFNVRQYLCDFL